jgi:hypothetical protein
MEPPMSNGSMQHQNPDFDFDDTRIILQGASCTIAADFFPRVCMAAHTTHRARRGGAIISDQQQVGTRELSAGLRVHGGAGEAGARGLARWRLARRLSAPPPPALRSGARAAV